MGQKTCSFVSFHKRYKKEISLVLATSANKFSQQPDSELLYPDQLDY